MRKSKAIQKYSLSEIISELHRRGWDISYTWYSIHLNRDSQMTEEMIEQDETSIRWSTLGKYNKSKKREVRDDNTNNE